MLGGGYLGGLPRWLGCLGWLTGVLVGNRRGGISVVFLELFSPWMLGWREERERLLDAGLGDQVSGQRCLSCEGFGSSTGTRRWDGCSSASCGESVV